MIAYCSQRINYEYGHVLTHARFSDLELSGANEMKTAIKPGDWIRLTPLWPGIWSVSRILSGFKEDQWSLDAPLKTSERVIVFCHRVVNDSWKRSFSHQCCELSHVRPLDFEDGRHIEALLSSDNKLRTAFERYRAKRNTIDLIANIAFGGLTTETATNFADLCNEMLADRIGTGMTLREVLLVLREHGLDQHRKEIPQQVTLQLTSTNHELRGHEFVFTRYRALGF